MRRYELVVILRPDLKTTEQKSKITKIQKLITDFQGKLKKKEDWGKKSLAYPINKFSEGIYQKFEFELPPEKLKEWENKLKSETEIIRYLLVKLEE